MTRRSQAALLIGLLLLPATIAAPADRGEERVDLAVVHRIKDEAFKRPKVMDHLFYLTDVNGPRLSGSPGHRTAAEWAVRSLHDWGIAGAKLEPWGRYGRGWSLVRYSAHLREPYYAPLAGVPLAWTAGTEGAITAELVSAPLFTRVETERGDGSDPARLAERIEGYISANRGRLKGRVVLIEPTRELPPPTEAPSARHSDEKLASIEEAPEPYVPPPLEWPVTRLPEDPKKRRELMDSLPVIVKEEYYARLGKIRGRLSAFLREEGVAAVLSTDTRGEGGILFAEEGGRWETGEPTPPPVVSMPPEPYARIARLLDKKIPVRVELDVQVKFHDRAEGVNVIAEIPGGKKRDEVVMLGAHLDSWHAATGATDNAAGCSVVLEAMRILKALDLEMDRTVRLGLWDGEEEGYYGSKAHVMVRFGDPVTLQLKPEHARFAGYFNLDNGTGKIRGVYLQGNDMVRPIFEAWLAPFKDLGARALTIRGTGGTDHLLFDAVGLPGFQFIQDPLDYSSRTHHSDLDFYDHVVPADLMQASAVLASFAYHAATRPELLPRKPLPRPLPPPKEAPIPMGPVW